MVNTHPLNYLRQLCGTTIRAVCCALLALSLTVSSDAAAKSKHKPLHVLTSSTTHRVTPVLSLPFVGSGLPQSLIYRASEQPIGTHNAVSFWLKGDSLPGTIDVYLMASGGDAASALPVPGSGHDTEPLWPAWISKPISTDFSGWKKEVIAISDFGYRQPDGADPAAPQAQINTIDAFGIASSKSDGTIYLDAPSWATLDSDGNATGDSAPIDSFASGNLSVWKVKGSPEAVANLVPGITSLQPNVKDDAVSLRLDYSGLSSDHALLASGVAHSMTESGNDFVVSVPSSPFERILPDSLPTANEVSSRVAITECPDQTSCGSFAIYTLHGLSNVSVHLTNDLLAISKSIPRSDVNISVVKVWDREGSGVLIDPDSAGPLPELLVKDDRIQLASVNGVPPAVRLTGDVNTDIPANTEKQFWVDVTVPRNTPPGQYTAQMLVRSNEAAPFRITLEADVMPLRLLSPAKQYAINYRGKLGSDTTSDAVPGDHVTPVQLSSELYDVSAHGLRYISLSDSPDTLTTTLTTEQQYNFQTPMIYPVESGFTGLLTAKAVTKLGGDPSQYYYLVPDGPSMAADLARLKVAGFQTAALIDDESVFSTVQNNLDVAIYPVEYPYVQDLLRDDGKRQSSTRDWLTWPAAQDDPQVNRLYAGYLLWKTDLYGGYISDYETYYDVHTTLRPAMLTYPTQDGVIDTIQWEAIREGINDVRYLTTFYAALRECKDAKVDSVQVAKAQADVSSFLDSAFWLMSDGDYEKGRMMIANYALQLRRAVDGYNSKQSGTSQQSSADLLGKRKSG